MPKSRLFNPFHFSCAHTSLSLSFSPPLHFLIPLSLAIFLRFSTVPVSFSSVFFQCLFTRYVFFIFYSCQISFVRSSLCLRSFSRHGVFCAPISRIHPRNSLLLRDIYYVNHLRDNWNKAEGCRWVWWYVSTFCIKIHTCINLHVRLALREYVAFEVLSKCNLYICAHKAQNSPFFLLFFS